MNHNLIYNFLKKNLLHFGVHIFNVYHDKANTQQNSSF